VLERASVVSPSLDPEDPNSPHAADLEPSR